MGGGLVVVAGTDPFGDETWVAHLAPALAGDCDLRTGTAALRRLFDEVAAAIGPGGATDDAGQLMARLDAELKAHFQMEEVSGIFD